MKRDLEESQILLDNLSLKFNQKKEEVSKTIQKISDINEKLETKQEQLNLIYDQVFYISFLNLLF